MNVLADSGTVFPVQAMKDAEVEKGVLRCCTLIGCFVPPHEYMPLVLAQLDAATDTAAEGASIAVLTALTQGAGRPHITHCADTGLVHFWVKLAMTHLQGYTHYQQLIHPQC